MTIRTAPVLAAAALAAVLIAGCGSDSTSGTAPTEPPTSSGGSGVTMTPPHDFVMASEVTVVRSGGLKGDSTRWVFSLDQQPPKGFTAHDVNAVLKAAADPLLKSIDTTPGNPCCDRYVYRITIVLPDGTSHTYAAVEGDDQPPPLADLLDLVA